MDSREYAGRVAVITGGARGFGKAFGAALAERGATVALVDRDEPAVLATAAELGDRVTGFAGDITNEARMNAVMAEIAGRWGGIDILINNAGLHSQEYSRPMRELGLDKFRRLIDVNVNGLVVCTFAAVAHMAGRPGANIINISSASAFMPGGYGVSKLAAVGLTLTFSLELAAEQIRVNAIAPGVILTDTVVNEIPATTLARIRGVQHVQRHGEEVDIVHAMLYLTSDRAGFISGETLRVTGGFAAGI